MAEKVRNPYQKPQLRRVKLEREESVLTACKVSSSDPTASSPSKPCGHGACKATLGS